MSSTQILAGLVSAHTAVIVALIVALGRTRERLSRLEGRLNGQRRD